MQGLGVLFFVFSAVAFACGFLGISGGMSGDLKLALLGTALLVSGSVFIAAGAMADRLRSVPEAGSRQVPGGAPAAAGAAAEIEPPPHRNESAGAMRRPGFHRAGARREAA